MKNPWVIIAILTVVLFGGAFLYSSNVQKSADEGVEVTPHVAGNPESDVVLVEYADFQCPSCAVFHPVVKEVLDTYGDQIRFEFKHFPLIRIHPAAEPAARAAEAAGQQGKFFEYYDKLFENQETWSSSQNPSQYFLQYATELELDLDQFTQQQRSSLLRDRIESDMAEGIEAGVTGTPTFYLNGQKLEMAVLSDLITAVEAALGITASTTEPVAPAAADVRFDL